MFERLHKFAEHNALAFIVGVLIVVSIGGLAQIMPLIFQPPGASRPPLQIPYTATEIAGRAIYIRESCGLCHSQQVRPLARRSAAIWRTVFAGRVCIRPPVFVGIQTHRSGSCTGRRKIFGRMASFAFAQSAGGRADFNYARLSVAGRTHSRRETRPKNDGGFATTRRALYARTNSKRRPRTKRRKRNGCANRIFAIARTARGKGAMSGVGVLIVIGDILISGALVTLAAWLFCGAGKESLDAAARIPLDEDDE